MLMYGDLHGSEDGGTGLTRLTNTPEKDERVPRTSPDGTMFTYNYGDYLMDVATPRTREHWGGYVWTPDSKQTVYCEKNRLVYTDIETGKTCPSQKLYPAIVSTTRTYVEWDDD